MSGTDTVRIIPGTRLHSAVGAESLEGEYFCNYAVNADYEPRFEAAGLKVSARDPRGETRAVELPGHRFFISTLFQPQLASTADEPHPLLLAFLKACQDHQRERRRHSL